MHDPKDLNIEDTGKLMTQAESTGKKKVIIIAVVAVLAVVVIAALGIKLVGDKKYNDQIAIAEKAFSEGSYEQAETEYLKAVDMNKRKPEAREGLAYVYAVEGKFEEAADTYNGLYDDTKDEKYLKAKNDAEKEQVTDDPSLVIGGTPEEPPEQKPEVVTEMNDAMEEEFIDFVSYLPFYSNKASWGHDWTDEEYNYYNYEEAADCGILFSILWNLPCINFDTYPLDFDRTSMIEAGETDPLGRAFFDNGEQMMCYRTNAEAVNWVAKNIFNASDEQIARELEESEKRTQLGETERMGNFYLHDGVYYFIAGGLGWETVYDFSIDDVTVAGDFMDITYTQNEHYFAEEERTPHRYKVRMQYKIIDGKGYWSMYTRELL